jgi:hypothetical protein
MDDPRPNHWTDQRSKHPNAAPLIFPGRGTVTDTARTCSKPMRAIVIKDFDAVKRKVNDILLRVSDNPIPRALRPQKRVAASCLRFRR